MNIQDIKDFANETREKISKRYNKTTEELIPLHALKVGEEVGEMFEQILAFKEFQREDKIINKSEIGEEIADVILASMLLASSLDLDIEAELSKKMEKNRQRLK